MQVVQRTHVSADQLRWRFDVSQLKFETTAGVDPASEVFGQSTAEEALRFGMLCNAPGQNIYVRGTRGTGRLLLVRTLLRELNLRTEQKRDRCYVHNFKRPDRPRLITLAPGTAADFRRRVLELAEFIGEGMIKSLESEPFASQRNAIKESYQQMAQSLSDPLEEDLAKSEMTLTTVQQGDLTVPAILPVVEGKPIGPEQLREMAKQGEISKERVEQFEARYADFRRQMHAIGRQVNELYREAAAQVLRFNQQSAREMLADLTAKIRADFPGTGVLDFINDVVEDALENHLESSDEDGDSPESTEIYGVNIVLQNEDPTKRPVVQEMTPNLMNLLGTVEPRSGPEGVAYSDYRGIRGGALLNADQGFLILNVDDLMAEGGAWRALTRTLRTGSLEIVPPEFGWMRPFVVVQPEPIPINVRVILIGDADTFYWLDQVDADFRDLFKVLADFESQIERSSSGVHQYAAVLSRLSRDESLPHFDREAVGGLVEHGARIVARAEKLTARFGRIADIAREAAFLAVQGSSDVVTGLHVRQAIQRTKRRASLPSRRFQEFMENGTILVKTSGAIVGQINGLAVMQAGPLTYGFPARITASIGAGRSGLIDIEGSARLSGTIHTKGFYILGGLLRRLLRTDHPLAFSASLAFEQSYGGIDGDSASCAEICCLLSALTNIPIKQNLAITGAIDQHGNVQAIGGVNEKIEGFFDVCRHFGLTGDQGVVVPRSNVGDLMLREDLVDAAQHERFHIYAIDDVYDALELLTGFPAGNRDQGTHLPGTLLNIALEKAYEFWFRTLASPEALGKSKPH